MQGRRRLEPDGERAPPEVDLQENLTGGPSIVTLLWESQGGQALIGALEPKAAPRPRNRPRIPSPPISAAGMDVTNDIGGPVRTSSVC